MTTGANWNADVVVNLFTTGQSVDRTVFGDGAIATEDVEVTFTETYRVYESNTEVQSDSDVSTAGKAQAAAYFAQPVHPKKLYLIKAVYYVAGTELETSMDAALQDIQEAGGDFYGWTVMSRTDDDFAHAALWATANKRPVIVQSDDALAKAGTASNPFDTLQALNNKHGWSLWHDTDSEYADVAWLAQILAADPDNRASVAYDKTLTGIPVSSGLTNTNKTNITGFGGNLYLPFYGVDVMRPGKASEGSWIDEVILHDWITARVREDLAQYLINQSQLGRKVPYDQSGLNELGAVVGGRFRKGAQIGHFDPDSIVVTVPDIDEVSAATKASRAATIEATAEITGGIATVTVNIGITT
jgi:hypothetical protein